MRSFLLFIFVFFLESINAENVLKVGILSAVGDINPQGYGQNKMFAQNMVYEGLVKVDKNGEIVPSLATSWELADSKNYIFTLRQGVSFSNGEKFDAFAVKKNFDSILKNKERHSWTRLAGLIESVEILDDFRIKINLKRPYVGTLSELALIRPFRFIAPSQIPDDLDLLKSKHKPIGTGAYKFLESVYGVSDIFMKNENYWDKTNYNNVYFDKIIMYHIFEASAKVFALKSGKIDLIYGLENISIDVFNRFVELENSNSSDFKTFSSPPIFTIFLALNPKNIESSVREAISLGINKTDLNKAVFEGSVYDLGDIADSLFDKKIKIDYDFSPQKARWILESSGYKMGSDGIYYKDSKKLDFGMMYEGNIPVQKAIAEVLQYQLKKMGIALRLMPKESSIYNNLQHTGDFDISFSATWGVPYEPLIMLSAMSRGVHVFSILRFLPNFKKINEKLEIALESSESSQSFILDPIKLIIDSRIYIPLHYQRNLAIAKKDLMGINMGVSTYEIPFWEFYR